MGEILLQSALAASKSERLSAQASHIRSNCLAHHNDNNTNTDSKSLLSCSPCYETLLETFRASYLAPPPPSPDDPQHHHQQQEWFTSRRAFLTDLDLTIASAKQYQISPEAVDDRVRAERSSWYVSQVRGSLLRLLVEDRVGFEPQFEKLEYLVAAAAAAEGSADGVALAGTIAELLRTWPLAPENGVRDLPGRLAAAGDQAGRVEVLRGVFFAGEDGAVSEGCQKYVDMLAHQGLSMEQVVDRILEERQAAAGAREQTNKLNQRLDELRRARAAHELQKSKKAQRRESLAQQRVPDELYELPACTVCGETPRTSDFFTCSVCTILADRGVRPQPTVFCSQTCEEKGHTSHAETHLCSSSSNCIQLQQPPQPNPSSPQHPNTDAHFCTECLTTLKLPTLWCSLACADNDFQRHRETIHLPERARLGLIVDDEQQLEYDHQDGSDGDGDGMNGGKRYRARDISAVTTSLEEAVREWEEKNRVRLQEVV